MLHRHGKKIVWWEDIDGVPARPAMGGCSVFQGGAGALIPFRLQVSDFEEDAVVFAAQHGSDLSAWRRKIRDLRLTAANIQSQLTSVSDLGLYRVDGRQMRSDMLTNVQRHRETFVEHLKRWTMTTAT